MLWSFRPLLVLFQKNWNVFIFPSLEIIHTCLYTIWYLIAWSLNTVTFSHESSIEKHLYLWWWEVRRTGVLVVFDPWWVFHTSSDCLMLRLSRNEHAGVRFSETYCLCATCCVVKLLSFFIEVPNQSSVLSPVQRKNASSVWSSVQDHRLDSRSLAPTQFMFITAWCTWSTCWTEAFSVLSGGAWSQPHNSEVSRVV